MFRLFKKKLQKRALEAVQEKVLQNRTRRFKQISEVSSIVFLYKADNGQIPVELYSFINKFEKKGVKVDVIIVYKGKQQPKVSEGEGVFHLIGQEDLSWYGLPKNDKILNLLQNNHDYFIDLTLSKNKLCVYLANSSMAHFKIGGLLYDNSPNDLTIEVSSDTDLGFFEEQLFSYLQKIG